MIWCTRINNPTWWHRNTCKFLIGVCRGQCKGVTNSVPLLQSQILKIGERWKSIFLFFLIFLLEIISMADSRVISGDYSSKGKTKQQHQDKLSTGRSMCLTVLQQRSTISFFDNNSNNEETEQWSMDVMPGDREQWSWKFLGLWRLWYHERINWEKVLLYYFFCLQFTKKSYV